MMVTFEEIQGGEVIRLENGDEVFVEGVFQEGRETARPSDVILLEVREIHEGRGFDVTGDRDDPIFVVEKNASEMYFLAGARA